MLQTQTVAADTLALIQRLMGDDHLKDFVLVGGTALALQLGHRKSIDIDLFTSCPFDAASLALSLKDQYNAGDIRVLKNGVFCYINDVKVDLVTHAFPELDPHQTTNGIRIMSLTDIAAMKLHAIVLSGARLKDFVDVHFLLEHMPLAKMYAAYEEKYHPYAYAAVARLGLNDTSRINLKDEIQLMNRAFNWPDIRQRLQTAMEFPHKVFRLPQKVHPPLDPLPGKKKGRRI